MVEQKRQIHFGKILRAIGRTTDGWRHPQVDESAGTKFDFYKEKTKLAEEALFDFVFVADRLYISEKSDPRYLNLFEPLTLLSALAAVTDKIGLVGTVSSTFSQPFTASRQLMSLDHLSDGRTGWNLVTSTQAGAARNHGMDAFPNHGQRYAIAQEHLDVVRGLWRSWEHDAFIRNKETGQYFDPEKLHRINFKGEFFQVDGPLNIGRSKQGEPVVFQAGASSAGRDLGARNADAIFISYATIEEAKESYDDLKKRAAEAGRNPDEVKVMLEIIPIIGDTQAEAEAKYQEFAKLIPIEHAIVYLGRYFDEYDFSQFELDAPFPELGDLGSNAFQSITNTIKKNAKEKNMTLRQVAIEVASPRSNFIGSPQVIANQIADWFESEAVDGFIVGSDIPGNFRKFVEEVIPILQERGLYRTAYPADTLRENLGLPPLK